MFFSSCVGIWRAEMSNRLRVLPWMLMLFVASCASSAPTPERTPEKELDSKLLDVELVREPLVRAQPTEVDAAPEEMSKTIDGDGGDWTNSRVRTFSDATAVETGGEFWTDGEDLALDVGIHADHGYVYFLIRVTDDVVLPATTEPGEPIDRIIFWFRDIIMDDLLRSLPPGYEDMLKAEVGIAVGVDGSIVFAGSRGEELPADHALAAISMTETGYVVEAAFRLEALEEISEMPLREIAFRVEVHDVDRLGLGATLMSTSPVQRPGGSADRFSRFELPGLRPSSDVHGRVPGKSALGSWRFDGEAWRFTHLGAPPKGWIGVTEPNLLRDDLVADKVDSGLCTYESPSLKILDAYESSRGDHISALVMCHPEDTARCGDESTSDVSWILASKRSGKWQVASSVDVFVGPLAQCGDMGRDGEAVHMDFALFPLTPLGPRFWSAGWTSVRETRDLRAVKTGVQVLHAKKSRGPVHGQIIREDFSRPLARSLTENRVYFTHIDGNDSMDMCLVETTTEQSCEGMDKRCVADERGETLTPLAFMWNSIKRSFDPYLLTRHQRCDSDFDLVSQGGFILLLAGGKLGLLPAPERGVRGRGL
jgi:hypothetical protein